MKKLLLLAVTCLAISCSTQIKSHSYHQDSQLTVTRRCIGNFIDFRHTGPETISGPDLIWIRTTQYSTFGKISAYGKECKFEEGEKIYIKRLYSTPGPNGNWDYVVENDSSDVYMMSNFRYENNMLVMANF